MRYSSSITAVLLALFVCLRCSPAAAQSPSGHTLSGVVEDTSGAAMVSVEVSISRDAGVEPRTTTTDAAGRFTFSELPGGAYRVSASAQGFADAAARLTMAKEPIVEIKLVMHVVVAEHVEVTTESTPNSLVGLGATTLSGAALDALPDDPGALLQRLRELAGATGSAGQVTVTIDGFNQPMWMPPKQAIQAIRISSNWFAPEFTEPGQARVEVITKPGSSGVHGEARFNFNDEAMNARHALAREHASGQTRDLTGYVSGPLIPGRWSFVLYGGRWSQHTSNVINATVIDSAYRPAPYITTVSSPSTVDNLWLGTGYQIARSHTLSASLSRTMEDARDLGLDSGLDLKDRAYSKSARDTALRATLTSAPSLHLLNDLRVQLNPQASTVKADSAAPAIIVLDAFSSGGNQDALLTTARSADASLADTVTLYRNRHTVKAGMEVRSIGHSYSDSTNFGGVFLFGTALDRNADGLTNGGWISPLENYRRTLLGIAGYGPSQFWIGRGTPEVRITERTVGTFVQDDWAASPRLSFSYGARTDWQSAARSGASMRGGLALALDARRKNVIRAGSGTFYRRIDPQLTLDVTRLDGRHQEQLFIERPAFFPAVPDNLAGTASRPTIYLADAALRAPQVLMSAVSYEHAFDRNMFVTLKYAHQYGRHLLRTISLSDAAAAQAARILEYESTGHLERHELTTGWRMSPRARASLFANYSYVHGRSDTDSRVTAPADALRLDEEWGPMAGERTHWANLGADLYLRGGVMVSPYLIAASGEPFNITSGLDNNGDGLFADRPAVVDGGTPGAVDTRYGWLLPNGTADATMVERNAGRNPGLVRVDLRVSRAFHRERLGTFVIAGNVENVLNRANLMAVNGVITSPSFGLPKRSGNPRRVDLTAAFSF